MGGGGGWGGCDGNGEMREQVGRQWRCTLSAHVVCIVLGSSLVLRGELPVLHDIVFIMHFM